MYKAVKYNGNQKILELKTCIFPLKTIAFLTNSDCINANNFNCDNDDKSGSQQTEEIKLPNSI